MMIAIVILLIKENLHILHNSLIEKRREEQNFSAKNTFLSPNMKFEL